MTADTQERQDHAALQALAIEYANAIDRHDWARLDAVFLPDAQIDYTATGGICARYPVIREWLARNLRFFRSHMHLMGNFHFEISGDQAAGQVACCNPMVIPTLLGGSRTVVYGIWYHDRYVRTPQGWRIAERRQQRCYALNVPLWMQLATWWLARRARRSSSRP